MPVSELFDSITGSVHYVGAGTDLSTLFLFENSHRYVHQDLVDYNLFLSLRALEQRDIISRLTKISDTES